MILTKGKTMKKELTLNQTWTLCLRMWRWIAKVWQTPRYKRYNVEELKEIWLKKNGYKPDGLFRGCFFCDYRGILNSCQGCCPGNIVDRYFHCCSDSYLYSVYPVGFYKELLRLNRIRKGKSNDSNNRSNCAN